MKIKFQWPVVFVRKPAPAPTAPKRKLVVVQHMNQYTAYCREHNLNPWNRRDALMIDHTDKLRGLDGRNNDLVLVAYPYDDPDGSKFHMYRALMDR